MKEIFRKIILKDNKMYLSCKILFCCFFAFFIMMDHTLVFNGDIIGKISDNYFTNITFSDILIFIASLLLSFVGITILEFLVDRLDGRIFDNKRVRKGNKKVFFITFLILLILWIPYILSYFPGGVFADTVVSINEALGKQRLYNHNPILYTLILKFFLNIGFLINSNNGQIIGLMIFTIVQVLVMNAVISYYICWTYKKGLALKYVMLEILFFGLFNLIPLYAISLWKDTVFCLALFLYIIFIADIIYTNGDKLKKIPEILHYSILITLVIFLRNNGIYIVLFTNTILLFAYRKRLTNQLRKFTIASIITIIICYAIQGPLFKILNLNTEFVENLGVFIQQICYVVATDGNMNEEQLNYVNEIIPVEKIKEVYSPCIVDAVKWDEQFNGKQIDNDKIKFFKIWFELFIQNPESYTKAYMLNTIGFWNITKSTSNAYTNQTMWPTVQDIPEYKQNDYIEKLTNKSMRNLLKPHIYISSAVFLIITLIGCLMTMSKRRYMNLIIYVPMIISWVTIMIAVPVAFSMRYVYILVLALPMAITIPFLNKKK